MNRTLPTLLMLLSCGGVLADDAVDFRNDIVPLLTKNGCNAGACHGAAIGRGGFKLSLYGSNPNADYAAIVHQVKGRRVNLSTPANSLILLKPMEHISHGGNMVFDDDSHSAKLLLKWIANGVKANSSRRLQRIEIQPKRHVAGSPGESVQLKAVAHYSSGPPRDVSEWTIFKAEDASAVQIHSQIANVQRRGRHIVVARFLDQVVPVELIVPLTDQQIAVAANGGNFIDDEVARTLVTLGLPMSPEIDDAAFLRRATLNLTGRLPSVDDIEHLLSTASRRTSETASGNHRTDNRTKMIDRLLSSEHFTEYWTLQLAKLLRLKPPQSDPEAARVYHTWLSQQIQADVSYKQLARELILASGNTREIGPANFYRTVTGSREQAEFMSELFMGSRLRCANCHNHPLDKWTQDDYHGLAAIFAKVEQGTVIQSKPNGEVIHPRTLEPASLRIPGEHFLDETKDSNAREELADWLTDASNPYFAKAIVNRLWKQMMGRGLVEPVDDFRATNPATHPDLLDRLADDFVANGYRIRHTLRVIASSRAYRRSANATDDNKDDDRFYSHAIRKPLEAEVLADAITDVLGVSERYGDQPADVRAVGLVNPKTPSTTLDILGRCGREETCEGLSGTTAGGLPQKLHLFNGPLLNARIAAKGSRLDQLWKSNNSPEQIVNDFYLAALGRQPTLKEARHWNQQIDTLDSDLDQRQFMEDFVWGLLTSNEFSHNN